MSPAEEDDWQRVLSDPDVADPALGPAHAIAVDMECLAMLNRSALLSPDPAPLLLLIIFLLARLPDTVEALSGELQKQLFNIMTKTTQQLVESGRYPQVWLLPLLLLLSLLHPHVGHISYSYYSYFSQGDQRLLPQLFSAVVAQLGRVVEAHRLASTAGGRAAARHGCDQARLEQGAVWGKVQAVMQVGRTTMGFLSYSD